MAILGQALLNGDISMGQYARGATVNATISGAQLALTAGGIARVRAAAQGASTFIGAVGQGMKIGAGYGATYSSLDTLGGRMADAVAGVEHGTTWGEDAVTIAEGMLKGAILGGALSGTAYGAVKAYQSLQNTVGGLMDVRYGPKNLEPVTGPVVKSQPPLPPAGAGGAVKSAPAYEFERLEARSLLNKQKIAEYTASMKANGWQGAPISVFEHNGSKYILDGHHRVAAARAAGIKVPYNSFPESRLPEFNYKSIDEVIWSAAEAMGIK